MILSSLVLLSFQSGGLETAIAEANALAAQNNFTGAVQSLKDAGVEQSSDAAAWTAYGSLTAKWTESEIVAGRIKGLDAYDSWNDVAWIWSKTAALSGATDVVWVNWSEALLNANDLGNSQRTVADGLVKFADSAPLLLQEGRLHMTVARNKMELGDQEEASKGYQAAEASFRKAMEKAPETAAPCLRLGELLWTLFYASDGKDQTLHDGAIEAFKQAAEREPTGVDGGMVSQWLGAAGLPVFDILIEKDPENVLHYWYRGSIHYGSGPDAWDMTHKDFKKVLELNPQFTNAYYFLADGAMQRGAQLTTGGDESRGARAYGAAAKYWALYLKDFGPNHRATFQGEEALKNAADLFNWVAGYGSMEEGVVLLEWAVATYPDHGQAWNNLAFFLRDTGKTERSLAAYKRAHELNPSDPQIMNDYAVIYHYYLKTEDALARDLYVRAAARAEEMIQNGEVQDGDEDRIQTALRDARRNLQKLDAGNRVNG